MDLLSIIILCVKVALLYFAVINVVPAMIWIERKGAALIQDRPGPNRVGPWGLLQPIADSVKFLFKEDPVPTHVNKILFSAAPFIMLLPASLTLAAIPFADKAIVFGREIQIQIADLDVALIYVLAIGSLGIYGILLGGWASNNKYSMMGALRGSSQMISYEIPLGLAATGAVIIYGTFSLRTMVFAQEGLAWGFLPNWGVCYQPLGALLFLIASFAETNRLPFDLPETEAELVAGFHTEYGSMKFAVFFMAEYMNMVTASAMMTALFWGGWHIPYITDATLLSWLGNSVNLLALVQFGVFFTKIMAFMLIFVWIRWTLPRFRYDQLLRLAWLNLIPLALLNLVFTAVLLYFKEAA